MPKATQQRIILGVELESYTILLPEYRISREMTFPRKGVGEKGERFRRDTSIGTEYNSRPFETIREGLFLLKAGLRKYSHKYYRKKSRSRKGKQPLFVGGWRDRFAGAHIHVSEAGEKLALEDAKHLAGQIHDHLPLLIAIAANSPVWADELTSEATNRVLRASKKYFHPILRGTLTKKDMDEMTYNRARMTKPPTLEIRVLDSNIPEFLLASACIIKAIALAWLSGKKSKNKISRIAYLRSRIGAARHGMKAKLCWNGKWLKATDYLDRFFWVYRNELKKMDIPDQVWDTFKLLKRGYNGSQILSEAIALARKEHPQTWQRRFAKRYVQAADMLLSGNSILDFMARLKVRAPHIEKIWLGRRNLDLT